MLRIFIIATIVMVTASANNNLRKPLSSISSTSHYINHQRKNQRRHQRKIHRRHHKKRQRPPTAPKPDFTTSLSSHQRKSTVPLASLPPPYHGESPHLARTTDTTDTTATPTDATDTTESNSVLIAVVISCFVVFGVLVFIFYSKKRRKTEKKIKERKNNSESAFQPLIVKDLNFDIYHD
jgi:hypothetical protein